MLTKTYKVEGESDASSCDLRKYSFLPRLSLLLLSACIAATYFKSQTSFLEAAMKRPASKLHKAVQQITTKERRESDLCLAGRNNLLNLTIAVSKHLHVTGKDSNGFDI